MQTKQRTPCLSIAPIRLCMLSEKRVVGRALRVPSAESTASWPATAASSEGASSAFPSTTLRRWASEATADGLRASAVTLWPCASASRIRIFPVAPVAPMMRTFTPLLYVEEELAGSSFSPPRAYRPRPSPSSVASALLDHHITLHARQSVADDRAVHLVGAGVSEGHREHAALSRVQGLLQFGLACFANFALYALAVDLQVVLGGALVLGLERIGAWFAQSDGGGGELELGLLDGDGL